MANGQFPWQSGQDVGIKHLAHQAHLLVEAHLLPLKHCNPCRFLPPVLQGVKTEIGEIGHVQPWRQHPVDATGFLWSVVRGINPQAGIRSGGEGVGQHLKQ